MGYDGHPKPQRLRQNGPCLAFLEGMGQGFGMPSPSMVHLGGRLHEAG